MLIVLLVLAIGEGVAIALLVRLYEKEARDHAKDQIRDESKIEELTRKVNANVNDRQRLARYGLALLSTRMATHEKLKGHEASITPEAALADVQALAYDAAGVSVTVTPPFLEATTLIPVEPSPIASQTPPPLPKR